MLYNIFFFNKEGIYAKSRLSKKFFEFVELILFDWFILLYLLKYNVLPKLLKFWQVNDF